VYLATQDGLDRTVAIKVLRQTLAGSGEEFKRRFEHEGRMLAQLQHENIVKIFDIGATDNAVYMVMEYLRGLCQANSFVGDGFEVLGEKVRVYVTDPAGEPIREAYVTIADGNRIRARGLTDGRGVFEAPGVGAGTAVLVSKGDRYAVAR